MWWFFFPPYQNPETTLKRGELGWNNCRAEIRYLFHFTATSGNSTVHPDASRVPFWLLAVCCRKPCQCVLWVCVAVWQGQLDKLLQSTELASIPILFLVRNMTALFPYSLYFWLIHCFFLYTERNCAGESESSAALCCSFKGSIWIPLSHIVLCRPGGPKYLAHSRLFSYNLLCMCHLLMAVEEGRKNRAAGLAFVTWQ